MNKKKTLTECADKFGTDKGNFREGHNFAKNYEPYFVKLENPFILEIGVDKGASIDMYLEYFNNKCTIVCIDIEDKSEMYKDKSNVIFIQADQGDAEGLDKIVSELQRINIAFDVILDDGSHIWKHQFLTFEKLYKLLRVDGIYIIEDLHTGRYENTFYGNGNRKDSPLYYLNFFENSDLAHMDDLRIVESLIKNIVIFHNRNNVNSFSSTVVISFA